MSAESANVYEVTEADFENFVHDHFGDTHTLSLPRNTFLRLGGYPAGFKVCEDVHLLVRLCAISNRAGVICEPLGAYCIHDRSATRADRLRAQFDNVKTLEHLKGLTGGFPPPVRRGVMRRLRDARLNLGYALAKSGRRWRAIAAVAPSLLETPGWPAVRNLASILKG